MAGHARRALATGLVLALACGSAADEPPAEIAADTPAAPVSAAAVPAGETAAPPGELRDVDRSELTYTYGVAGGTGRYVPPAAGTYELPPIHTLRDHPLVSADGEPTTLFTLLGGRVAIVAFVYTTCIDTVGCPASNALLHRVDRALAADSALATRVTLLTISFDPERDTPGRMALQRQVHEPRTDWRFATAASEQALAPVLDDFGQQVAKLRYEDGRWTGLFRHVLKVFLVDGQRRIREIYSAGYLEPAVVLNDVRTVLLEADGTPAVAGEMASGGRSTPP
jgi:cytochrome oxidase Cu insertion factor (SCO1/SenC/PrrC family)